MNILIDINCITFYIVIREVITMAKGRSYSMVKEVIKQNLNGVFTGQSCPSCGSKIISKHDNGLEKVWCVGCLKQSVKSWTVESAVSEFKLLAMC